MDLNAKYEIGLGKREIDGESYNEELCIFI